MVTDNTERDAVEKLILDAIRMGVGWPMEDAVDRYVHERTEAFLASDVWRNRQAEAVIDDDRAKAIRGLDYWAKHADNPAVRVDCAHARDLLAARPVITDEMVERADRAWDDYRGNRLSSMRAALEAVFGENHESEGWES